MTLDLNATGAHAFLFDSCLGGTWYGDTFDSPFLKALSRADPEGTVSSRILRGDAIPDELATRVVAVAASGNRSSRTQDTDKDLLKTIVWDMADAIAGQWHTIDLVSAPGMLATGQLYCICLPSMCRQIAHAIDRAVSRRRGYIGAIEVDLGNPTQKSVFVEYLFKSAAVVDGQILMEADSDGHPYGRLSGADRFKPRGLGLVYPWPSSAVPLIPTLQMSERGRITSQRLEGKYRTISLQARVLDALSGWLSRPQSTAYEFHFTEFDSAFIDATLSEAKFVKYLLNPEHPKNLGKAKFFADVLGLTAGDWRYLAAQLHDGLRDADLTEVYVKQFEGTFGVSFNANIPVRGLNGNVVFLDTNWMMEPGKIPHFSTATPADRKLKAPIDHPMPSVVSDNLTGDERWATIYDLAVRAAQAAAIECVPTSMKLVGSPTVEMEGKHGWAYVIVPDARRGFARWLIKSENGDRWPRGGASVYSLIGSQSYDRAVAYANAFAGVLRHNGIVCEVSSRLD
jgi:hypothetical protein